MSASTPLPFLYQTRTILRLASVGTRIQLVRAFSHTVPSHIPRRSPIDSIPFELPTDFKPRKEEVGEPDEPKEDQETGAAGRSTITERERETFNVIFNEMARLRQPAPAPPTLRGRRSAENRAPYPTDEGDLEQFLEDAMPSESGTPDPELGQATIGAIVQHALDPVRAGGRRMTAHFDKSHPLGQVASSDDPVKALLRFPPSLRDAARRALGVLEASIEDVKKKTAEAAGAASGHGTASVAEKGVAGKASSSSLMTPISLEMDMGRRKERFRVEKLMRASQTDRELWRVMEEQVFTMVERLGIAETTKQEMPAANQQAAGAAVDATAATATAAERPAPLNLFFYGPLYPLYLLYGLRLLDQHFARSSPLCLNVLSRVKELGLASYLLGITTPFYNTLGNIYWARYGNAKAVFDMLEEMRYAGLYFDENSKRLVQRIDMVHQMAMGTHEDGGSTKRLHTPFVRAIANMPDNRLVLRARINYWHKAIGHSMQDRNQALGLKLGFADPNYEQSMYTKAEAEAPKEWEL